MEAMDIEDETPKITLGNSGDGITVMPDFTDTELLQDAFARPVMQDEGGIIDMESASTQENVGLSLGDSLIEMSTQKAEPETVETDQAALQSVKDSVVKTEEGIPEMPTIDSTSEKVPDEKILISNIVSLSHSPNEAKVENQVTSSGTSKESIDTDAVVSSTSVADNSQVSNRTPDDSIDNQVSTTIQSDLDKTGTDTEASSDGKEIDKPVHRIIGNITTMDKSADWLPTIEAIQSNAAFDSTTTDEEMSKETDTSPYECSVDVVKCFACHHCNRGFVEKIHLEKHNCIPFNDPPKRMITCKVCNKSFEDRSSLYKHVQKYHVKEDLKKVTCKQCNKKFIDHADLAQHKISAHKTLMFKCRTCGAQFPRFTYLQSHMIDKHKTRAKLKVDPAAAEESLRITRGLIKKDEQKQSPDAKPGVRFSKASKIVFTSKFNQDNKTALKKDPEKPAQSKASKVVFVSQLDQKRGRGRPPKDKTKAVLGMVEAKTPQEKKTVPQKPQFKKITKRKAEENMSPIITGKRNDASRLKCKRCGKKFSQILELAEHRKEGTCDIATEREVGIKRECEECGKEFSDIRNLERHLLRCQGSDNEEEEFFCDLCDKGFKTKYQLDMHNSTKHKELMKKKEQFQCRLCDKFFLSEYKLKMHRINQHKVKSTADDDFKFEERITLECEECKESFDNKDGLLRHVLQTGHTGDKHLIKVTKKVVSVPTTKDIADEEEPDDMDEPMDFSDDDADWTPDLEGMNTSPQKSMTPKIALKGNADLNASSQEEPKFHCSCSDSFDEVKDFEAHMEQTSHDPAEFQTKENDVWVATVPPDSNEIESGDNSETEAQYVCYFCQKTFGNKSSLRTHLALKHKVYKKVDDKPNVGRPRKKVTEHKSILEVVMDSGEDEEGYVCRVCSRVYSSVKGLQRHEKETGHEQTIPRVEMQKTPRKDLDYKCEHCDKAYQNEKGLKRHAIETGHGREKLEDPYGPESFLVPEDPETLTEDGKKILKCKECDKICSTIEEFREHVKTHPLKCRFCDKTFEKRQALANHEKSHESPKPGTSGTPKQRGLTPRDSSTPRGKINCKVCQRPFLNAHALHIHQEKKHGISVFNKAHTCEICNMRFAQPHLLRAHMALKHENQKDYKSISKEEKPLYSCDLCEGVFVLEKNLKAHISMKHSKDSPQYKTLNEYECHLCNKKLGKRAALYKHVTVVHKIPFGKVRHFECEICDEAFSEQKELDAHVAMHNERKFQCPHCPLKFYRERGLELHMKKHEDDPNKSTTSRSLGVRKTLPKSLYDGDDDDNLQDSSDSFEKYFNETPEKPHIESPFTCDQCGKIFIAQVYLERHKACHSKAHRCHVCLESFATARQLEFHRSTHHPSVQKKLLCPHPKCPKYFYKQSVLDAHRRKFHGRFPCRFCGKRFDVVATLNDHIVVHSGEMPYLCDVCNKNFRTLETLKGHYLTNHLKKSDKKTKGNHPCETCGKIFMSKGVKEFHVRKIHTGEKPFTCKTCGTKFYSRYTLNFHRKSAHPEEFPQKDDSGKIVRLECPHCPQTFSSKFALKHHEFKHTGQKPYKCSHCTRSFRLPSMLRSHEMMHTGEARHVCDVCGKAFILAARLRKHIKIHTGDHLIHECSVCTKVFGTKRSLKTHMLNHLDDRPFLCHTCGKPFRTQKQLSIHEERHIDPNSSDAPDRIRLCHLCGSSFRYHSWFVKHTKMHEQGLEPAEIARIESEARKKLESSQKEKKKSQILVMPREEGWKPRVPVFKQMQNSSGKVVVVLPPKGSGGQPQLAGMTKSPGGTMYKGSPIRKQADGSSILVVKDSASQQQQQVTYDALGNPIVTSGDQIQSADVSTTNQMLDTSLSGQQQQYMQDENGQLIPIQTSADGTVQQQFTTNTNTVETPKQDSGEPPKKKKQVYLVQTNNGYMLVEDPAMLTKMGLKVPQQTTNQQLEQSIKTEEQEKASEDYTSKEGEIPSQDMNVDYSTPQLSYGTDALATDTMGADDIGTDSNMETENKQDVFDSGMGFETKQETTLDSEVGPKVDQQTDTLTSSSLNTPGGLIVTDSGTYMIKSKKEEQSVASETSLPSTSVYQSSSATTANSASSSSWLDTLADAATSTPKAETTAKSPSAAKKTKYIISYGGKRYVCIVDNSDKTRGAKSDSSTAATSTATTSSTPQTIGLKNLLTKAQQQKTAALSTSQQSTESTSVAATLLSSMSSAPKTPSKSVKHPTLFDSPTAGINTTVKYESQDTPASVNTSEIPETPAAQTVATPSAQTTTSTTSTTEEKTDKSKTKYVIVKKGDKYLLIPQSAAKSVASKLEGSAKLTTTKKATTSAQFTPTSSRGVKLTTGGTGLGTLDMSSIKVEASSSSNQATTVTTQGASSSKRYVSLLQQQQQQQQQQTTTSDQIQAGQSLLTNTSQAASSLLTGNTEGSTGSDKKEYVMYLVTDPTTGKQTLHYALPPGLQQQDQAGMFVSDSQTESQLASEQTSQQSLLSGNQTSLFVSSSGSLFTDTSSQLSSDAYIATSQAGGEEYSTQYITDPASTTTTTQYVTETGEAIDQETAAQYTTQYVTETGELIDPSQLRYTTDPNTGEIIPQYAPTDPNTGEILQQQYTDPNTGEILQQQYTDPNTGEIIQQQITDPNTGEVLQQQLTDPNTGEILQQQLTDPNTGEVLQQQLTDPNTGEVLQQQLTDPNTGEVLQQQLTDPNTGEVLQQQLTDPNTGEVLQQQLTDPNTGEVLQEQLTDPNTEELSQHLTDPASGESLQEPLTDQNTEEPLQETDSTEMLPQQIANPDEELKHQTGEENTEEELQENNQTIKQEFTETEDTSEQQELQYPDSGELKQENTESPMEGIESIKQEEQNVPEQYMESDNQAVDESPQQASEQQTYVDAEGNQLLYTTAADDGTAQGQIQYQFVDDQGQTVQYVYSNAGEQQQQEGEVDTTETTAEGLVGSGAGNIHMFVQDGITYYYTTGGTGEEQDATEMEATAMTVGEGEQQQGGEEMMEQQQYMLEGDQVVAQDDDSQQQQQLGEHPTTTSTTTTTTPLLDDNMPQHTDVFLQGAEQQQQQQQQDDQGGAIMYSTDGQTDYLDGDLFMSDWKTEWDNFDNTALKPHISNHSVKQWWENYNEDDSANDIDLDKQPLYVDGTDDDRIQTSENNVEKSVPVVEIRPSYEECDLCNLRFSSSSSYDKHIANVEPFFCPKKPQQLKNPLKKGPKYRKSQCEIPFVCNECERTFANFSAIKKHLISVHMNNEPSYCLVCDMEIAIGIEDVDEIKEAFSDHLELHVTFWEKPRNDRPKTPVAPTNSIAPPQTEKHERMCEICGYGFTSKTDYEDHMDIEHAEMSLMQDFTVTTIDNVDQEEITEILEPGEIKADGTSFVCEFCKTEFDNANSYVIHMISHNKELEMKERARREEEEAALEQARRMKEEQAAAKKLRKKAINKEVFIEMDEEAGEISAIFNEEESFEGRVEQSMNEEEKKYIDYIDSENPVNDSNVSFDAEDEINQDSCELETTNEGEEETNVSYIEYIEEESETIAEEVDDNMHEDDLLRKCVESIDDNDEEEENDGNYNIEYENNNDENEENHENSEIADENESDVTPDVITIKPEKDELQPVRKSQRKRKAKYNFEPSKAVMEEMLYSCEICERNFSSMASVRRHISQVHIKKEIKKERLEKEESNDVNETAHESYEFLEEIEANELQSEAMEEEIDDVQDPEFNIDQDDLQELESDEENIPKTPIKKEKRMAQNFDGLPVSKKRKTNAGNDKSLKREYVYFPPLVPALNNPISVIKSADGKEIYRCDHCGKVFPSLRSTKRHISSTHVRKGEVTLVGFNSTEKESNEVDNLINNAATVAVTEPETKKVVKKALEAIDDLESAGEKSKENETKDLPFSCDECNENFASSEELEVHEKSVHKDEVVTCYKCDSCDKVFNTERKLLAHDSKVHKIEMVLAEVKEMDEDNDDVNENYDEENAHSDDCFNIKEEQIKKTKGRQQSVTAKKKKDATRKPFECESCHKDFATKNSLRVHMTMVHAGRKPKRASVLSTHPYRCNICKSRFTTEDDYQDHLDCPTCPLCNEEFESCRQYKPHKETHTKAEWKKLKVRHCDLCGMSFSKAGGLRLHRLLHNICNFCDMQCDSADHLTLHLKEKHGNLVNTICPHCGLRFTKKWNLDIHIKKYHSSDDNSKLEIRVSSDGRRRGRRQGETICDFCGKKFDKVYEMKRHRTQHTGEKPCACDLCDERFATPSARAIHRNKVHLNKTYPCTICNIVFKHSVTRNRHMETHPELEKNFTCEKCGAQFVYRSSYRYHLTKRCMDPVMESMLNKPFKCTECAMSFQYDHGLINHRIKEHEDTSPYRCDACPERYSSAPELIFHRKSHGHVKEYHCGACKIEFTSQSSLDFHNKQYHSARTFTSCKMCGKVCRGLAALTEHQFNVHTEADRQSCACEVCGKQYDYISALKRHMQAKHNPDKPHRCKVCQRSYKTDNELHQHKMERHPPGQMFSCKFCPSAYNYLATLVRHMKDKHGVVHGGVHNAEVVGTELITKAKRRTVIRPPRKSLSLQCTHCSATFQYVATLNRHMREKHDIVIENAPTFDIKSSIKVVPPRKGNLEQNEDETGLRIDTHDSDPDYEPDEIKKDSSKTESAEQQVLYMMPNDVQTDATSQEQYVLSIPDNSENVVIDEVQYVQDPTASGVQYIETTDGGVQYIQSTDGVQYIQNSDGTVQYMQEVEGSTTQEILDTETVSGLINTTDGNLQMVQDGTNIVQYLSEGGQEVQYVVDTAATDTGNPGEYVMMEDESGQVFIMQQPKTETV